MNALWPIVILILICLVIFPAAHALGIRQRKRAWHKRMNGFGGHSAEDWQHLSDPKQGPTEDRPASLAWVALNKRR